MAATPPPIPSPQKFVTVRARSRHDLNKFIVALRQAAKQSKLTGGVYAAFLPLSSGQRLQVDVGLADKRED